MIMPTVYQKKLEGKSNAHLITFSDGKDYVVKYFQTGFEKTLPNEWVAYCLARYLGLPIPYAQLVEIPQEFSSKVPELAQMSHTNFQFASLYVPNCVDGHQVSNVSKIINHQSLASIILFDYWLCNGDRTRKNILLHEKSPDSYQLWVIDHAEVFGSFNWLQPDLDMLPIGILKSATHKLMAQFIEDEKHFTEQLELIQTMPILLIEEIVALIPDDWGVSMAEKKGMVTTLLSRRKNILPKLMQKFILNIYRPLHQNQG
ncbi:HipA family kinase [Peribacillus butanolivorans]|uniref:HipA family kinase n=1 Tax=Peribacillus butanolivorans TaxID=421767 RepID=UPI0007106CAE|nr:hypothetical protein ASG99_12090 [Bacillus sp. Soil768D1]